MTRFQPRAIGFLGVSLLGLGLGLGQEAERPAKPSDAVESSVSPCVLADCELFDGMRLTGHLSDADPSLAFRAGFGASLKIPFEGLSQIVVSDDRESTTLHFHNGDRLTGFMAADGLSLVSAGRKVEVAFPKLRHCRLRTLWATPAGAPLKVAATSASGAWAGHEAALAVDGDNSTFWNSGDWRGWLECDLGSAQKIVQIEVSILFSPPGNAQFDVYASDKPIGAARDGAKALKHLDGGFNNGDVFTVDCPRGTEGRYVQIACPKSVSWFAIRELKIVPAESKGPPISRTAQAS